MEMIQLSNGSAINPRLVVAVSKVRMRQDNARWEFGLNTVIANLPTPEACEWYFDFDTEQEANASRDAIISRIQEA